MNPIRRPARFRPALQRGTRRLFGCTRGNLTLFAAVALLGVSVFTGAAVTIWQLNAVGTELRDRVDALALASTLTVSGGGGEAEVAVRADQALAGMKGGESGSGAARVQIVSASTAEVVAVMSRDVRVVFGGLIGMQTLHIERSARAISSAGEPVCLHILSPDQPEAFSRRGTSSLEARACVAQVNSTSANALDSRGAAGGVATLRTRVSGAGGPTSGFSPPPEFRAPTVADPLAAAIDWPAAAPCGSSGLRLKRASRTLAPSVICGDLDLETGAELVLSPGVHVITGSLTMRAGARLVAEDATLVFVGDTSRLDIGSQADARFVAPDEGPWAGLAVAVKPQPAEHESNIQGGGAIDLTGVLYMPSQRLHLTGGGRLADPTDDLRMIVVNRLDLNGNGRVWLNGDDSPTRTAGGARLIE